MSFSSIPEVVNEWKQRGVELRTPASRDDIERTFMGLGQQVSTDVIELYQLADGYECNIYDDNHWYWWPLEYVREMAPYNPTNLVWFADYLIDSYYFALQYESPETATVHVYSYFKEEFDTFKIADSLTEFLHYAIHEPERVEIIPLGD